MKAILSIVYLLGVFSCVANETANQKAEMQAVVGIEDSRYIKISPKNGWFMSVMRDGSGSISFGSLPLDGATFPEGSIDYNQLYSDIVPRLESSPSAFKETAVAVVVMSEGKSSYVASYFDGVSYWNRLIEAVKAKLVPYSKTRFDKIVSDSPMLVPIQNDEHKSEGADVE